MAEVDPDDVTDVLGGNAELVVPLMTTMVKAYVRGRGFSGNEPNDELAAVITTAAARFVSNPKQLSHAQAIGPFNEDFRAGFNGWTLAEQMVLNRYRVRAQ